MATIDEARAQFQFLDKNGDRFIDLAELYVGLNDFGLTDAEIEAIFFYLDVNMDGRVSQEEFIAGYASFRQAADEKTQQEHAVAGDDGVSTGGAAAADSTAPAVDPPTEVLSASQHSPTTPLPTSSSQAVDDSDGVGEVAEDDGDSTGGATAPEAEPKEDEAEHGAGFYQCVAAIGVGVRTEPNETCGRSKTHDMLCHNDIREAVRLLDGTDSSGDALQYVEWKCGGYSPLVNPYDHTDIWFKYQYPLMVPSSATSSADRSERVCAVQAPAEWAAATQVRPPCCL